MKDTFEFTLNNPLTEEDWDMISDVDFDRTDRITFHTKHGKEVEFTKVIQCKDCARWATEDGKTGKCSELSKVLQCHATIAEFFCGMAEPKETE